MHYKTRGVVLISVLLIVLLLSSIAVLIGNNYFVSFKRAQYIEFQSVSLNVFRNIESLAIKKLNNELRFNSKLHSKNNPLFTNNFVFEANQGIVTGMIKDASNCFNINSIVVWDKNDYQPNNKNIEIFKRLAELNELDLNLVNEAIDQIIDWIDNNSNPRQFGLEDYFYSGPLNSPREYTGTRLFHSVSELKSIPGIRNIGWKFFNDNVCAFPDNSLKININTLEIKDDILLASMFDDMSQIEAQFIIDNIPKNGFKNIADLKESFPSYQFEEGKMHVKFSSSNFKLISTFTYDDLFSESISRIYYGKDNNGSNHSYIISRIYNGI